MSANLDKLTKLLAELFQFDQADLDFGIYRIMNQKRDDIKRFLDKDLLPQVKEAFAGYQSGDRAMTEAELEETIKQVEKLGVDPNTSSKIKELRAKLDKSMDITKLENEVFSDLYNFFRRYYHEGDFLSLRRYKEGVFAIPYEGEEVKLHWANHDQYYIKTSEYLRDYTFKLPSGKRVHFKLVEADTEKDNTRAQSGNERRFILCDENILEEKDGEFFIRFEYRHDPEKRKQKDLNTQAVQAILGLSGFKTWLAELAQFKPTEANPNRTLLEKHLTEYTARNTFDYFIHKDLGGFLRRELDFYIKNEVMHLDDIENETALKVEQYLSKIKVIRKIAHKVIDFLAQIENFQKKLWLKKKFVVETNYCITIDQIPEEIYPEIAANDGQREEWVKLFAIDEISDNLTAPGYSKPLKVEFLKAHQFLVIDTKHFNQQFKDRLLASFEDVERKCDGLLIHSENLQALALLQKRYREQIKFVYIDPPYNTGEDGFLYKDSYRDSSWIAMMDDRLKFACKLLQKDGIHFVSIGDDEEGNLRKLLDSIFLKQSVPFVWKSRAKPTNAGDAKYRPQIVAEFVYQNTGSDIADYFPLPSGQQRNYPHSDENGKYRTTTILTSNRGRYRRETMRFEIAGYRPPPEKRWKAGEEEIRELHETGRLGFNSDGEPFRKHYEGDEQEQHMPLWTFMPEDITGTAESGKSDLSSLVGKDHGLDSVKPKELITLFLNAVCGLDAYALDYFAGSGTTGHAVINLNREDGGHRKYILVEMGKYFDTVLMPRIQRIVFSKEWQDGKPISREGSSHMFKYVRLESYEDTLNNLQLKRSETQQKLLDSSDAFRESYMLSYMLDIESTGSASLLNLDSFDDPFNYKLKIATGSAGETKPITVDLVETFNYLLGLTVRHIDHIRGFRVIQGTNPKGERVLVIWRNLKEKSNEDLDEFFRKQEYNPKDMEFDLIYVNGDNNLENLRQDETWKVRIIEEEFQRLMFDVEDI